MNNLVRSRPEGQALVQVAVAMAVLLAFAALAVDGGHLYAERRRMQNAADAGALAGAHEICFGNPANAEAVAREYAIARNGAEGAEVTVQEWEVGVVATETVELFLTGMIGLSEIPIRAEAAAACRAATTSCKMWPVAFSNRNWDPTCGAKYFLWMSDDEEPGSCGEYYCDVYCDGVNFFLPLNPRTWLDYTAVLDDGEPDPCDEPGCGQNELRWRMWNCKKQKWSDPCLPGNECRSVITIPSCAQGDTGVRNPAWQAAADMVPSIVRFPLYNGEPGSCNVQEPCAGQGCCGNPSLGYDLSDFGCVQLLGITRLCDKKKVCKSADQGGCPSGPKVILVQVPCDENGQSPPECATACGWAGTEPPRPGDVRAVSLVK